MSLSAITDDVIRQVQEKSGKPVLVTPDSSLKLMAKVMMARGNAPAHHISFNPSIGLAADYVIAYQCGFIIRAFTSAPANRFDLVGTFRGRKETLKLMTEHLRNSPFSSVPRDAREGLRDRLYDGLMLQLRSYPIGLRVDAWIASEYPQLAAQQRAGAERQLTENLQNLSPQIRQIAPEKVYNANLSMCAAFSQFWAAKWNEPMLAQPFTTTGHAAAGEELLSDFNLIPSDPDHDRQLVEAWGRRLGLEGWYELSASTVV